MEGEVVDERDAIIEEDAWELSFTCFGISQQEAHSLFEQVADVVYDVAADTVGSCGPYMEEVSTEGQSVDDDARFEFGSAANGSYARCRWCGWSRAGDGSRRQADAHECPGERLIREAERRRATREIEAKDTPGPWASGEPISQYDAGYHDALEWVVLGVVGRGVPEQEETT